MENVVYNATTGSMYNMQGTVTGLSFTMPIFFVLLAFSFLAFIFYAFDPKFKNFIDGFLVFAIRSIGDGVLIAGVLVTISSGLYLLSWLFTDKKAQEDIIRPFLGLFFIVLAACSTLGLIGYIGRWIFKKIDGIWKMEFGT